jgi:hypothetical protein
MEKGAVKLVVFNGDDFSYWKNQTRNYLLSQGRVIWEIVPEAYVIPNTLDHTTQVELQRYENNYKTLNLITTALGRNVYDMVAHLEMAHDVWLKLCNTYESSSEIKSSHRDIALLALSPLSVAYILVVLLLILAMNVLNNFSIHLMVLYGA